MLGYNYAYDYYGEHTGRATCAQSIYDSTLDRSYQYDQVGALVISHSGAEARASAYSGQWGIMDGPYSQGYDYDKFGNMTRRYGWGGEVQGGSAGQSSDIFYSYTNNRRDGFSYDTAGNLTNDLVQSYSYDATGQQTTASASSYFLQQGYDGDGLRAQKTEYGTTTYYLRSTVLGGQVVAELDGGGSWQRGYVYTGSSLLAVQQGGVNWVHEDSVTKSKRITDIYGNIVSTVELDPWGADTNRSSNVAFQPQSFTSYIRDGNGGQDAMARRYSPSSRFSQPDPSGGSYDFSDPQSLNRYAYTKNDPVNFSDPSGLDMNNSCSAEFGYEECGGDDGFWGGSRGRGGGFGGEVAEYNREYGGMPASAANALHLHNQRVNNAIGGYGFVTNEEVRRIIANAYVQDPETGELVFAGNEMWIEDTTFGLFGGGLNPLFSRNPSKPPDFWKGPQPPELVPTEPPPDLPGFPTKPHMGPDGFKIGPDQDLKYFREQGKSRLGARAGLRAIGELGKVIISITTPAVKFIDLAPIVVCGPCLNGAVNGPRGYPARRN